MNGHFGPPDPEPTHELTIVEQIDDAIDQVIADIHDFFDISGPDSGSDDSSSFDPYNHRRCKHAHQVC